MCCHQDNLVLRRTGVFTVACVFVCSVGLAHRWMGATGAGRLFSADLCIGEPTTKRINVKARRPDAALGRVLGTPQVRPGLGPNSRVGSCADTFLLLSSHLSPRNHGSCHLHPRLPVQDVCWERRLRQHPEQGRVPQPGDLSAAQLCQGRSRRSMTAPGSLTFSPHGSVRRYSILHKRVLSRRPPCF